MTDHEILIGISQAKWRLHHKAAQPTTSKYRSAQYHEAITRLSKAWDRIIHRWWLEQYGPPNYPMAPLSTHHAYFMPKSAR